MQELEKILEEMRERHRYLQKIMMEASRNA